eukprot:g33320.t1
MNQEINSLLKTRRAAFKSGDPDQCRKSSYDLCKAIRTKLEAETYQTDTHHLGRGLNNIMGYKIKQCKIADNDTSLPDMLNVFYARFEQNTTGMVTRAPTAPETRVPPVTASEIRSIFLGVNPRIVTRTVVSPAERSDPSVYCHNRSTEDAISLPLHSSLEHLYNKDTYISLLLIDYGSAFNILFSSRLISKLCYPGLGSALCNWILSSLTHRLQSDHKKLQKVVCTTQTIMEANLPSTNSIYTASCRGKAANFIKDPSHPEYESKLVENINAPI